MAILTNLNIRKYFLIDRFQKIASEIKIFGIKYELF